MKIDINYNLEYTQFREEDIYYFEIETSNLIDNKKGFTNSKGINLLKLGKYPDETYSYTLLSKDDIDNFRYYHFNDALGMSIKEDRNIFRDINKPEYELVEYNFSNRFISDLKGNNYPLMITFHSLYISNKDYDLDEVLEYLNSQNKFEFSCSTVGSDKVVKTRGKFFSLKISYCNSSDDRSEYIPLNWHPSKEQWDKLEKFMKDNSYKSYERQRIILKYGLLGFTEKEIK